jgi:hypothetical protein
MKTSQAIRDDHVVYVHRRLDTMEVFYVGKGKRSRVMKKTGRNKHWKHIADKHGYLSEIVEDGVQEWYALEKEVELIAYYGRSDQGRGPLVNMTDGGDGITNPSAEWKAAIGKRTSAHMKRLWATHAYREKVTNALRSTNLSHLTDTRRQTMQRLNADETFAEKRNALARERHKDPEYTKKLRGSVSEWYKKPENKEAATKRAKLVWEDADFRTRNKAGVQKKWKDPEFRAKNAAAVSASWRTEARRANHAKATKAAKAKAVVCLTNNMVFDSVSDAAAWATGKPYGKASGCHISSVCGGKRPTAFGHKWKLVGE